MQATLNVHACPLAVLGSQTELQTDPSSYSLCTPENSDTKKLGVTNLSMTFGLLIRMVCSFNMNCFK